MIGGYLVGSIATAKALRAVDEVDLFVGGGVEVVRGMMGRRKLVVRIGYCSKFSILFPYACYRFPFNLGLRPPWYSLRGDKNHK